MEDLGYLRSYREEFDKDYPIESKNFVPWVVGFFGMEWQRRCLLFQVARDAQTLQDLEQSTGNLGAATWACLAYLDSEHAEPKLLKLEAKLTGEDEDETWANATHPFREWRTIVANRATSAFSLKLHDPNETGDPTPRQRFAVVTMQCEAGLRFLAGQSGNDPASLV